MISVSNKDQAIRGVFLNYSEFSGKGYSVIIPDSQIIKIRTQKESKVKSETLVCICILPLKLNFILMKHMFLNMPFTTIWGWKMPCLIELLIWNSDWPGYNTQRYQIFLGIDIFFCLWYQRQIPKSVTPGASEKKSRRHYACSLHPLLLIISQDVHFFD